MITGTPKPKDPIATCTCGSLLDPNGMLGDPITAADGSKHSNLCLAASRIPKPLKLCPWCAIEPNVRTFLASNQGLKSACSFVNCPTCNAEKGVISMPGDEDLAAAEAQARNLWDTRKEAA